MLSFFMQACNGSELQHERNDEHNAKYYSLLQEIRALKKEIQKDSKTEQVQTKAVTLPKPFSQIQPKTDKEPPNNTMEKSAVNKKGDDNQSKSLD